MQVFFNLAIFGYNGVLVTKISGGFGIDRTENVKAGFQTS